MLKFSCIFHCLLVILIIGCSLYTDLQQLKHFIYYSVHMDRSKSLKISLLGDKNVGKTELLHCYLEHCFSKFDSGRTHEEIENHYIKNTTVDGIHYKLSLWDASSNQEYKTIKTQVYPFTDCFIVCYALNNAQSFASIYTKWLPEIKRHCPSARTIIVGTKVDLKNSYGATRVTDLSLEKLRIRERIDAILECSARTVEGVSQVFKEAIRSAHKKKEAQQCCIT